MKSYPLDSPIEAAGGRTLEAQGIRVTSDFGDPRAEYEDVLRGAGIHDARDRGVIEVAGTDRTAWLHNLVTNAVKTLRPGEGNYAFATNVKGRILFDCNIIVLADRIWIDIDRRYAAKAMAHFDRFHITEDIQLADRSDEFCRIIVLGPRAPEIAAALRATQAASMASVGSTFVPLAGKDRLMVRNDSVGVLGLEFFVETADAAECWDRLLDLSRPIARPVGQAALDVLRIEAGIPVYGQDIDEDTLPAETQQLDRAVSFVKGCYLGQEIVERMRSRGGLARKLVGLKLSGSAGVHPGNALKLNEKEVGRLTSVCESYAAKSTIGLGYVKTVFSEPLTRLTVESTAAIEAMIVPLPFRR